MKKKFMVGIFMLLISVSIGTNVFAMGWVQDARGWSYRNADGTCPANAWQWIDGRCYYFDESGYLFLGSVTPDGYTVDDLGAWTVNGTVQILTDEEEMPKYYRIDGKYIDSRTLGTFCSTEGDADFILEISSNDNLTLNVHLYGEILLDMTWIKVDEYFIAYQNEADVFDAVNIADGSHHVLAHSGRDDTFFETVGGTYLFTRMYD